MLCDRKRDSFQGKMIVVRTNGVAPTNVRSPLFPLQHYGRQQNKQFRMGTHSSTNQYPGLHHSSWLLLARADHEREVDSQVVTDLLI